ncbi:hypothetical protein BpHYR1_023333 [Brachionus plicatilis]|uniref:Uncharacterized protein n=1 Tax=Brachionus plicatilis TaxID=10195 RepID=A0A3M7SRK6_BRAPC|nr:hypothetical protein BpHYR1_023333 [Brachionus plicatilis]
MLSIKFGVDRRIFWLLISQFSTSRALFGFLQNLLVTNRHSVNDFSNLDKVMFWVFIDPNLLKTLIIKTWLGMDENNLQEADAKYLKNMKIF